MQDIFTPFPFELFKSPDIETLNWVLWLAQDGDWFPVGVSLRKPSWCPQEYTTEEQRQSGIRPFFILIWWNPRKPAASWFSIGSDCNQDYTGKVFQGKVSLWFINCSFAQSSTWHLHGSGLCQVLPPESLLGHGSSSCRRIFVLGFNSATGLQC